MKTALSEADFLRQVLQLAKLRGWRTAHFRPLRTANGSWRTAVQGDGAGFPDLLLLRGTRIIAAEMKVGKGKVTPEQDKWIKAFLDAGASAYVWYPENWKDIERILE
jgi:hypothetical protein